MGDRPARPARPCLDRSRHRDSDGNFCELAAARPAPLARFEWDPGRQGLYGAPPVTVIAGDERHVTIDTALRYLGLGTDHIVAVPSDEQGRIRVDPFLAALDRADGPTIVCLSAGNVHTGSFDRFDQLIPRARQKGRGSTSTERSGCGPQPARTTRICLRRG